MCSIFNSTNILYYNLATLVGDFDSVGELPAHIQCSIDKPITIHFYFKHNGFVVCPGLAVLFPTPK